MKKILLLAIALLLSSNAAIAQTTATLCTQTTNVNGGNNCVPVSATNPLPISVFGGTNGQCYVSNGTKGAFTTCPGGGTSLTVTSTNTIGLGYPIYSTTTGAVSTVYVDTTSPFTYNNGALNALNLTVSANTALSGTTTVANEIVTGYIYDKEHQDTFSTSIAVSFTTANSHLILANTTSAVGITLSGGFPGEHATVETCNSGVTGGAITFTGGHYSGGSQPGNTTTSGSCDFWFWYVTNGIAGSTEYLLEGMTPGVTGL